MKSTPTFFLGDNDGSGTFTHPLDISGLNLTLSSVTPRPARNYTITPLLHRIRGYLDDSSPSVRWEIEMRLGINQEDQGEALQAMGVLWTTIGGDKQHLWVVDDSTAVIGSADNGETAGASVTVEVTDNISGQSDWLANTYFIFYDGTNEEVVVASSVVAGTSFVADLQANHSASDELWRVEMVFPDAVLADIRPSELPLGKGSLVLTWLSARNPLYISTLPT